jgi:hypothetical protein
MIFHLASLTMSSVKYGIYRDRRSRYFMWQSLTMSPVKFGAYRFMRY